jgi:hypothetical protein
MTRGTQPDDEVVIDAGDMKPSSVRGGISSNLWQGTVTMALVVLEIKFPGCTNKVGAGDQRRRSQLSTVRMCRGGSLLCGVGGWRGKWAPVPRSYFPCALL